MLLCFLFVFVDVIKSIDSCERDHFVDIAANQGIRGQNIDFLGVILAQTVTISDNNCRIICQLSIEGNVEIG